MSLPSKRLRVGDMRPSQMLFSYGIGAIVDLPHLSVLMMGLDDWREAECRIIVEERLLAAVRERLGPQVQHLFAPPIPPTDGGGVPDGSLAGVPVACFPRWMLCPKCRKLAPLGSGLFELKTDLVRTDRTRWIHRNCQKEGRPPEVHPIQFLVACDRGHLDDFPWNRYVHGGKTGCSGDLRFYDFAPSGGAAGLSVHCQTCGAQRSMAQAFDLEPQPPLGTCTGRRPHLRDEDPDGCDRPMKAILAGASNSWFPCVLSALSVPSATARIDQDVEALWAFLEDVESAAAVKSRYRFAECKPLAGYPPEDVWEAIERRRSQTGGDGQPRVDLKSPEWARLSDPDPRYNTADFRLAAASVPPGFGAYFARIIQAERLREVQAFIGFTRIESPGDLSDEDAWTAERRAPLSRRRPQWVPACEVRGEGLFLQFDEEALQRWESLPEVQVREVAFQQSHIRWRRVRKFEHPELGWPSIRYVLLHSFSHALMRQLAVECGYSAASIRERIYAVPPSQESGPMAGILLYTCAPDSEGTLGGLVSLGAPSILSRHLSRALEAARLCASDPLCAEHPPSEDGQTLHAAACHACLFAPETSCERGNRYLDRALLVDTVATEQLAFFASVDLGDLPRATQPSLQDSLASSDGAHDADNPALFAVRLETNDVEDVVPAGARALFRKLEEGDPLPDKGSIVMMGDGEHTLIRRFSYAVRANADGVRSHTRVSLRAASRDLSIKTMHIDVPTREWDSWRPYAVLVERID